MDKPPDRPLASPRGGVWIALPYAPPSPVRTPFEPGPFLRFRDGSHLPDHAFAGNVQRSLQRASYPILPGPDTWGPGPVLLHWPKGQIRPFAVSAGSRPAGAPSAAEPGGKIPLRTW